MRIANIYLVGMMGAGKTTVGRELAKRLGRRFVDCDHEIESRTGVGIPVIFEIEGEEGFRRRETQELDELSRQPDNAGPHETDQLPIQRRVALHVPHGYNPRTYPCKPA